MLNSTNTEQSTTTQQPTQRQHTRRIVGIHIRLPRTGSPHDTLRTPLRADRWGVEAKLKAHEAQDGLLIRQCLKPCFSASLPRNNGLSL